MAKSSKKQEGCLFLLIKFVFYICGLIFAIGVGGIVLIAVVAIYASLLIFRFLVFLAKKIVATIKAHRQNKKSEKIIEIPDKILTTTQQKEALKADEKPNKAKENERKTGFYIGEQKVSLDEYARYCNAHIEHEEEMKQYEQLLVEEAKDKQEKQYNDRHKNMKINIEEYAKYCNAYLHKQDMKEEYGKWFKDNEEDK